MSFIYSEECQISLNEQGWGKGAGFRTAVKSGGNNIKMQEAGLGDVAQKHV